MKYFLSIFLMTTLNGIVIPVQAQHGKDSMASMRRDYYRPKVILVMLHLSSNKIKALKKRGRSADAEEVIRYDEEVNNSIMADFAANFSFCPVYFFYDSSYDDARNKQWEKIVFYDYESLKKKKLVSTNAFSAFYFAEIGYRTPDKHLQVSNDIPERLIDRWEGEEESAATRNYGINLYYEDFEPIRSKFGFTDISLRSRGPLFGKKKMVFEGAEKFDKKLRARFELKPVE